MTSEIRQIFSGLMAKQHGVAAVWQLLEEGFKRTAVDRFLRLYQPLRIHPGVYGEPSALGLMMAAVLAAGSGAALGRRSGLGLWGLREPPEGPFQVCVAGDGGIRQRDGFVIHRSAAFQVERCAGIPVMSPTRCLQDARLPRYAAYRALEAAEAARLAVDLPALKGPVLQEVRAVLALGNNPTRSDAEARVIFHCRDRGIEAPIVNHQLNGVEADFHWPRARLVLEVDGWEYHRERKHFEEDRRRNLVHRIAGWEVIRVSAWQVQRTPQDVCAAVLAAAPYLQAA